MNLFRKKNFSQDNDDLKYFDFKKIEGSNYLIVSLCSSEKGFKGNYYYSPQNYLFLDITNFSTHWLFPDNNQIIKSLVQIPTDYFPSANFRGLYEENNYSNKETPPISWLLFNVCKDEEEISSIFISDVTGKNPVMLIDKVRFLRDKIRLNDDSLVLLYSSEEKEFISEVKLSEHKVLQTKELPKIQ